MQSLTRYVKSFSMFLFAVTLVVSTIWQPVTTTAISASLALTQMPPSGDWTTSTSPPSAQSGSTSAATTTWKVFIPTISKPDEISWSMAGANPQRTSWTPEQVPSADYMAAHRNSWGNGVLYPQWYKQFDAYIPHVVQIIGANGLLYVSTSRGLYAVSASTGDLRWIYPTEMPLGHSPTVYGGTVYVGGLDHKLYAIEANPDASQLPLQPDSSGQNVRVNSHVRWTFEAEAGFETNPLVIGDTLYAGNRDGYLYAVNTADGTQRWKFATGGPILFSAAASRDGSTIFFASNDSYAYAVDAQTGEQIWKSAKLPGAGFSSWWPVVYQDSQTQLEYVLLSGSQNYRDNVPPGPEGHLRNLEQLDREIWQGPDNYSDSGSAVGTLIGVRSSDGSIDTTRNDPDAAMSVSQYYQNKPWRRTYFVLDALTGQEHTPYAPFVWLGSQSGNRIPSIVGANHRIYQSAALYYRDTISAGSILDWIPGSVEVRTPASAAFAVDEPVYASSGGSIVYWASHDDGAAGAFDTSVPNSAFGDVNPYREWIYWTAGATFNGNLRKMFPNYDQGSRPWSFGGVDGTYGRNGDGNPPIPYKGKVYFHMGNSLLAFGTTPTTLGVEVTPARVVPVTSSPVQVDLAVLKARLNGEIQKMVAAGHLRPGYFSSGHIDGDVYHICGDVLLDYFHNPADTLWVLSASVPYLTPDVAQNAKTYLQSEYAAYNPAFITHVGWRDGASRDWFDLPPDVDADRVNYPPAALGRDFVGWGENYGGTNLPPYAFYAMWKYAQAVGLTSAEVHAMLNATRSRLDTSPPGASVLALYPFVHNAYIAGYQGYLALQGMGGETPSPGIQSTLNSLLQSRAANFTGSAGAYPLDNCNAFNASRNWMWMTPELGRYLRDNALSKVQATVNEYQRITPYWFVAGFPDTTGEAIHQPMYDVLLLQAKALILREPAGELVKYLDVPAFARGDLFYIQNLVSAIEAAGTP